MNSSVLAVATAAAADAMARVAIMPDAVAARSNLMST